MRLFAAVLPPDPAVAELAARVGALRRLPGADGLRWTERAGWHFTLAFFGQVDESVLPALHERLARAAHRHPPHEVRLAGGGRFADKVVWAGVEGDRATLGHLADSAEAGARRAGVAMERHRRPYHPHLTLARCRGGADLRPYVDGLADFEGSAWTVAELSLVRSHPPAPGVPGAQPRYEVVAAWPLGH
ncbi:RNA 2',3'-cyclic phosphodiesterase [Streptomyces sparsogenes]|uniref:RNA 2',3'-cyclic phosphodiesterase n=1 Tax=Streptomyces sparsogenes TaxID=67365 RepID=UPI00082423AA|nr:RNA 2',3'-cyclic phosphodiesterase [Streptomyces sparsogenes]